MLGTILIVDGDQESAESLRDVLRDRGHTADSVVSGQRCLQYLHARPADVVITDAEIPDMDGIDLCGALRERHPDSLPIVVARSCDVSTAVAAMRAGAHDYMTKPVTLESIEHAIKRALDHLESGREVTRLREINRDVRIDGIAGNSIAMRSMLEIIRRVAASDASVLITGESGTGKELVARAIHDTSARRGRPFVAVNCAAMPAALLESELFGHVRGAFTDAKQDRKGLFLKAEGGTILLDEIGEMPLEMQVKLLRVLQQRTVRPVGGDEEVPFDARVVTSTNRDLEEEIEHKRFREDLYYRINVVQIAVPALRDRHGDILILAEHFVAQAAHRVRRAVKSIAPAAARLLVDFDWPGNVRELENVIERAVALCRFEELTVDDLPARVREYRSSRVEIATDSLPELITMDEMDRRYARLVLEAVRGNKTQAARVLGIDRRSLYRRLADDPGCGVRG
jgi:two-component system response regulator HydG